jgi:hypothetical protein
MNEAKHASHGHQTLATAGLMGTKSLAPTQAALAPTASMVTKIVPHVPTTWAAPNVENQPTPDGAGVTIKTVLAN